MQGSARIDELRQKFHENPRRYFAPLANEYRKAGDPEQAIAICRAHLAQQPGHMSGHVVYAQALYDARRIDESRVVFEKALSLDPDNAIVLRQLGDISRQKGDTAEARHWYTRALDTDPHDREIAAYIAELTEPLTEPAPETPSEPEPETPFEPEPETTSEPEPETPPEPPRETVEEIEAAPAEELSPPAEVEIEIPKAEEPPALADMPGFEADEALFAADEDIELFPDASSPFVTRTMADLYARQGYNDQALEVYRKLAADNPHDQEIADRIRELSPADTSPPPESHDKPASNEFAEPEDDSAGFGFTPSDELTLESVGDGASDRPAAASPEKPVHFTDTDLGAGDEWDMDSWAAGFSSEETEVVPFDFVASNDIAESTDSADVGVEAETSVAESETAKEPETEEEAWRSEDVDPEQEEGLEYADPEHFVAYSPQPPEDEDLPHYTPVGPTIREFFATLGAYRPPANGAAASFTARAAVPDIDAEPLSSEPEVWTTDEESSASLAEETQPADEFPLVTDAFANLFPDSPVSEEDSKAAFALSGALSSQPNQPVTRSYEAPQAPAPAANVVTPPSPAQESEEDIRRFREWLDGLADS